MCGIIGYVGRAEAVPILLDGLRRLEYRGYDSAGVALLQGRDTGGDIAIRKCIGRIDNLAQHILDHPVSGSLGISHTRWATHGKVTDQNAHPHTDASGRIALVHNGVIENYQSLRETLRTEGHEFRSETDTEVLAHLIGHHYDRLSDGDNGATPSKARLIEALRKALQQVSGTYGIGLLHSDFPGLLVGARRGSPLVLGVGKDENFLASDVSAIVAHTRDAIYLNDHEIAALTGEGFEITSVAGNDVSHQVSRVEFSEEDVKKGDFPHYMLKEIYEQPDAITDSLRGRLSTDESTAILGGLNMTPAELRNVDRIILAGCGTALHAAMIGEYAIESLAHIPVEVEFASELRYRNLPIDKNTLVFVISQSGETADTLAALRECRRKGHRVLGICNNVASTIARESDGGVYMHAGPEIGVAATKTFTSQVTILGLIAVLLGRMRHLSTSEGIRLLREFEALPDKIREVLQLNSQMKRIAQKYAGSIGMLFMGRQFNYPVALEGALKMKEISYLHAEGHPSAELKHGVIALVNPDLPSVFIAPDDAVFEKNLSNIEEVKARRGPVIAIGTEGRAELESVADDVVYIPRAADFLTPILAAIPLQMLAYHTAVQLGCDVDKPRNLAKSVTVE